LVFCNITKYVYFNKWRVKYYTKKGAILDPTVSIAPNVRISGKLEMGKYSSLAHNISISGENAGIKIGYYVMIAPSTLIVAFNHDNKRIDIPMFFQEKIEEKVVIEDDVWIGANVTILPGSYISKATIIAANSVVNKFIEPYSIIGGTPAKIIKKRT
jgi:acetyltransferase-like isoleucine patch superfamily enzyme